MVGGLMRFAGRTVIAAIASLLLIEALHIVLSLWCSCAHR